MKVVYKVYELVYWENEDYSCIDLLFDRADFNTKQEALDFIRDASKSKEKFTILEVYVNE